MEDRKEKLAAVLELVHVVFICGLLVELLQGLPCRLNEDHNLQAPEKMELVRAKSFQLSLDLHSGRPH